MARFLAPPSAPVVGAVADGGAGGGPPAGVTSPTPAAAASSQAATSAEKRYVALSLLLTVVGLGLGLFLQDHYHPNLSGLPQLAAGTSPFALLYIFAQSIERLLEVVSPLLGGSLGVAGGDWATKSTLVEARDAAWVAAVEAPESEQKKAAVDAQHKVEQFRANSAVVSVGLATLLAMSASGYLGVFFLRMLGVTSTGIVLDILVTGLAIGGGTKPLHDLISNVQKAKEAKQDPPELKA